MKWRILTTGKPSFPWTRDGVEMYSKRLQRFASVRLLTLKQGAVWKDYQQASEGCFRLLLDERGQDLGTEALYRQLLDWEQDGPREIAVCIGGADGFPPEARTGADRVLRLGSMTLMHELALLVWMEQLYRIYALKENLPYHRP